MISREKQPAGGGVPNPMEQEQRERSVLIRFLRLAFFVMMVTVALLLVFQQQSESSSESGLGVVRPRIGNVAPTDIGAGAGGSAQTPSRLSAPPSSGQGIAINFWPMLVGAVAFFLMIVLLDLLTPNKRIAAISGVFLGMVTGILATVALSFVIDLVVRTWIPDETVYNAIHPLLATAKVMMGISLCYLGISTVLQTQDQFRLVIPYVEFSKQLRGVRPNLLDTSALIDARIVDFAGTGLVQSALVVPRFVIAELQLLADSGDRLKRGRGRRGLDVVTRLQRLGTVEVIIDETPVAALGVDQMLVELAEKIGGRIITTDLGLARVAQIKGLVAINLHDLANTLRPALVPGEQINIRLVKGGEQAGQAVGYLDDGTMVVAEGGAQHIGEEVMLLVTSTMQTTAGRLVFARPMGDGEGSGFTTEHTEDTEKGSGETNEGAPAAKAESAPVGKSAPAPIPASAGPFGPNKGGGGGARRGATPRNPRRMGPGGE